MKSKGSWEDYTNTEHGVGEGIGCEEIHNHKEEYEDF